MPPIVPGYGGKLILETVASGERERQTCQGRKHREGEGFHGRGQPNLWVEEFRAWREIAHDTSRS